MKKQQLINIYKEYEQRLSKLKGELRKENIIQMNKIKNKLASKFNYCVITDSKII